MGIKSARAKAKRTDPLFQTVAVRHWESGEEESFRFRRPTSRSLSPSEAALERIAAAAPSLHPDNRSEVALLADCYMPDSDDGSIVAEEEFAKLAVDDDLYFQSIVEAFVGAFPEFTKWIVMRTSAGNVSGGGSAVSGAGSTSLPSGSADSPANSPT